MFNITELLKNEISVWEQLKNSAKPVVLYGMGDGADKVLAAFDRYGIKASAVIASDDFVRGQKFHGFTVKSTKRLSPLFLFLATDFLTVILLPKIKSKLKVHTVCLPTTFQKRFTKTF